MTNNRIMNRAHDIASRNRVYPAALTLADIIWSIIGALCVAFIFAMILGGYH